MSYVGGLAAAIHKPLKYLLNYFTARHFFAKIIKEMYAIRQSKIEFFEHYGIKPSAEVIVTSDQLR